MSTDPRFDNVLGVELLLRVVAEEAGRRSCSHCAASLAGAPVRLREQELEQAVVEITCRACGGIVVLRIEPEADGGVARTG